MKKFLIALLSLAMLFSFAACDNSSNTPDDTEEPSGGEGTVTFSDENVKAAWSHVIEDFTVNTGVTGFEGAIKDLLGYRSSAYVDLLDSTEVGTGYTVEVSDDYATLTVTRAVSDASAEGVYPAQEAKLVANGIVKTRTSESAPIDVVFNDFTYTAKTYDTIGDNVVAIDASISGYFQGKVSAEINTKNDNKTPDTYEVTADLDAIVLKQNASDFSLALNGETITAGRAFDILGQNFNSKVTTFAANKKTTDDTVKGYIAAYVNKLLANKEFGSDPDKYTASTLFDALQTKAVADTKHEEITVSYTGTAITIKYTPAADATLVSDTETIKLAKGSTLDITVTGTGNTTDTAFTPETATISGKFAVSGHAADSEAVVKEIVTTDLQVAVSGNVAVANNVANIGTLAFSADADDVSGSVKTTIAYGPAIEASTTESAGWVLVDGDVTKSYN